MGATYSKTIGATISKICWRESSVAREFAADRAEQQLQPQTPLPPTTDTNVVDISSPSEPVVLSAPVLSSNSDVVYIDSISRPIRLASSRRTSVRSSVVIQGETDASSFNDDDPLDLCSTTMVSLRPSEPEPDTSSEGSLSVSTRIEYSALPSRRTQDVYGLITVHAGPCPRASDGETEERQPMDIVVVIDVSGSMQGDKIRQVQDATRFIVEQADQKDRLSLVAFNSNATRALRLRKMSAEGKNEAHVATLRLAAGGGTSIAAGLDMAVSVIERRRQRNKISSILLLTDGQDGSTRNRLPDLVQRAAQANCSIYAFGFGRDHDAALLSEIAEQAHAPFTYIQETERIREAFAGAVGGLSSIVAQNVQLTLKCHVPLKHIHTNFPVQHTTHEAVVTIPDMFALERRDILVELAVPASGSESIQIALLEASSRYNDLLGNRIVRTEPVVMEAQCSEEPQPEDEPDDEVSAQRERVEVMRALQDAAQASDEGNFDQALHVIEACDTRMKSAKYRSPANDVLVQELEDARNQMRCRASWEQGGRAEIRDSFQMHSMQRCTTSIPSERSRKSTRTMYCSLTQDRFIRRSSGTL